MEAGIAAVTKQAESRGLSAFDRLRMTIMPADSERARGLPRQTPRPQERAGTARGTERVNSPAPLFEGRCGEPSPQRWVTGRPIWAPCREETSSHQETKNC